MDDGEIIALLFDRKDDGIKELKRSYGALIRSVAYGVLGSKDDAEECENETYHAVWKKIPPERPDNLRAYTVGIARHIALDKFRASHRNKRVSSDMTDALDDLGEVLTDDWSPEDGAVEEELKNEINRFLSECDADTRVFFVLRYYYCLSLPNIAAKTGRKIKDVRRLSDNLKRNLYSYLKEKELI